MQRLGFATYKKSHPTGSTSQAYTHMRTPPYHFDPNRFSWLFAILLFGWSKKEGGLLLLS